jgi:hypothetical protein
MTTEIDDDTEDENEPDDLDEAKLAIALEVELLSGRDDTPAKNAVLRVLSMWIHTGASLFRSVRLLRCVGRHEPRAWRQHQGGVGATRHSGGG